MSKVDDSYPHVRSATPPAPSTTASTCTILAPATTSMAATRVLLPEDPSSSTMISSKTLSTPEHGEDHPRNDVEVGTQPPVKKNKVATSKTTQQSTSSRSSSRLSPHIHRLIRLIQLDGTAAAATRLIQVVSSTSSDAKWTNTTTTTTTTGDDSLQQEEPYWELIGRLQALLSSKQWKTRYQAARALHGVAASIVRTTPTKWRSSPIGQSSQLPTQLDGKEEERNVVTRYANNGNMDPNPQQLIHELKDDTMETQIKPILSMDQIQVHELLNMTSDGDNLETADAADNPLLLLARPMDLDDDDSGNESDTYEHNHNRSYDHDQNLAINAQERFRQQQHIIARRLGLIGMATTPEDAVTATSTFITPDDVNIPSAANRSEPPPASSSSAANMDDVKAPQRQVSELQNRTQPKQEARTKKRKRKKRWRHWDDETVERKKPAIGDDHIDVLSENNTLRALLHALTSHNPSSDAILQPTHETSDPSSILSLSSSSSPHVVLAIDFIHRMLDPYWHIRHGSFLGILALYRGGWWSWSNIEIRRYCEAILSVSLCVLSLDRFGDYSGAIVLPPDEASSSSVVTSTMNATTITTTTMASSVVAPVREMAGQVVADLWFRAPKDLQDRTLQHLHTMRNSVKCDWEVRHSALIAFKYIVALSLPLRDRPLAPIADARIQAMIQSAVEALHKDDCDDVKSVAAQLLVHFFHFCDAQGKPNWLANIKVDAMRALWSALTQTESHSGCLVDLVALLCIFVQDDCNALLQQVEFLSRDRHGDSEMASAAGEVAQTLMQLIDCEFESVQRAAFQCIESLAAPLSLQCVRVGDRSPYTTLMSRVFETYLKPTSHFGTGSNRNAAWNSLASNCATVVANDAGSWSELLMSLIGIYFGWHLSAPLAAKVDPFEVHVHASQALSLVIAGTGHCGGDVAQFPALNQALLSFLRSPWSSQCEAACQLMVSLVATSKNLSSRRDASSNRFDAADSVVPKSIASILLDWLTGTTRPNCLAMDPLRSPAIRDDLEDEVIFRRCQDAYRHSVSRLDDSHSSVVDCSDAVVEIWKQLFRMDFSPQSLEEPSEHSMRLKATIAGAVLATGLPAKLTPVIRALMTSLKNETSKARISWTCECLVNLLMVIEDDPRFANAKEKILDTVCDMALSAQCLENAVVARGAQVVSTYVSKITEKKGLDDLGSIWRRVAPLLNSDDLSDNCIIGSANFLCFVGQGLHHPSDSEISELIRCLLKRLTEYACKSDRKAVWLACVSAIEGLSFEYRASALAATITALLPQTNLVERRGAASALIERLVTDAGQRICPFVQTLLPIVMSLMADPSEECARSANHAFASLVRLAPLTNDQVPILVGGIQTSKSDSVIDHLILGKPLPRVSLPQAVCQSLRTARVLLRPYQEEGVAWLSFLQSVNLNGALCDAMGLGKTLQALIAIALSHFDTGSIGSSECSIIVCPSTLVGHWAAEVRKFFPGTAVFQTLSYVGSRSQRHDIWEGMSATVNLVLTSYAVLRNDVQLLSKKAWRVCVLDEGHLLKNSKTATARAARRLCSQHRLILTGTPVQNKIKELWAVFDFLMPNFLGSSASFADEFERPIVKSQLADAKASVIAAGMERLKALHQQVLPFILRREKSDVLRELPPKVVSDVKVSMSDFQAKLYGRIASDSNIQLSLERLHLSLDAIADPKGPTGVDAKTMKSLFLLRLLCTHPALIMKDEVACSETCGWVRSIEMSGKFLALVDILQNMGLIDFSVTAADNDTSLLYCDDEGDEPLVDSYATFLETAEDPGISPESNSVPPVSKRKCIIFAQFTRSLDLVENLVLKPLLRTIRYLRLDGSIPSNKRTAIANAFNEDPTISVLLATTRVGGLGLNLTGAETVIFLENDFNPFADIQAQDRAHRIGQAKCVNVYNLVTEASVEEKIMELQRKKISLSEAIVNTDNSSLHSMGTDRLLDIFTSRSNAKEDVAKSDSILDMDALIEQYCQDYASLSLEEFLRGIEQTS